MLWQCGVGELLEIFQAAHDIPPKVYSQNRPLSLSQYIEVASGLCRFDDAERVLLAGHRNIDHVVTRDLKEHPRVRSALVRLTRRVQESRAESEAGGDVLPIAHEVPDGLQRSLMLVGHRNVGQEREVAVRLQSRKVCLQTIDCPSRAISRLGCVRGIRVESENTFSAVRRFVETLLASTSG